MTHRLPSLSSFSLPSSPPLRLAAPGRSPVNSGEVPFAHTLAEAGGKPEPPVAGEDRDRSADAPPAPDHRGLPEGRGPDPAAPGEPAAPRTDVDASGAAPGEVTSDDGPPDAPPAAQAAAAGADSAPPATLPVAVAPPPPDAAPGAAAAGTPASQPIAQTIPGPALQPSVTPAVNAVAPAPSDAPADPAAQGAPPRPALHGTPGDGPPVPPRPEASPPAPATADGASTPAPAADPATSAAAPPPEAPPAPAPRRGRPVENTSRAADGPAATSSPVAPATAEPALRADPAGTQAAASGRPAAPARPVASLEEEPSAGNGRERGPRLAPAAARAVQVEAGVHLENLAGPPSGAGDRPAVTAAANALAGGLRVQALEAHGLLAVGDPAGTDNTARVVRGLSAMVGQRGGVMTMRLAPPELGAVRVQMTIVQGSVTAQFTPTTEHAGALLRGHLGVLRTALEGHGLHVERLSVHVAATESSPGGARHDGDSPTSHDRDERHDAGEHESRGRRHGRHPDRRGTGGKPADFRGVIGRSGTGSEPRHQGANTT